MKKYKLIDQYVWDISNYEINQFVLDAISKNKKTVISNVNANAYYISRDNSDFYEFQKKADIIICDSKWVQIALKYLYGVWVNHLSYYLWIPQLYTFCNEKKLKVFLLGTNEQNLQKAIKNFRVEYPDIIFESRNGFFNKDNHENEEVINKINSFRPHLLMVGMGMPFQEKWIADNMSKIHANVFTNGGAFIDVFSGEKVIPKWITSMGVEWLYRLIKEPRRMWKRYLFGNTYFLFKFLTQKN
tara:strand:+ start:17000 stop:17728 length:729 start_codon:yes stop_codon:yes gene_type:complete